MSFAGIGSFMGICLFFLDSESVYWHLISVLTIISNVSLGGSLVCLNSFVSCFLPLFLEYQKKEKLIEIEI